MDQAPAKCFRASLVSVVFSQLITRQPENKAKPNCENTEFCDLRSDPREGRANLCAIDIVV